MMLVTSSNNIGSSFSTPEIIGTQSEDLQKSGIHITTYESNVYIVDERATNLYLNSSNGSGNFAKINTGSFIYSDILTDKKGVTYLPTDDPNLSLFKVDESGNSVTEINLIPSGIVYYSSYAITDGSCGTYIFVAGRGNEGYKINVLTREITRITFGNNTYSNNGTDVKGRTIYADNDGLLVDGYKNSNGELVMSISYNQGETFQPSIVIAEGKSHNLTRNLFTDDIVVTFEKGGEIYLSVYESLVNKISIPQITPPILICEDNMFTIPFTTSGIFDINTEFTAILSDENGSFENSIQVGSSTINNIDCTIPEGLVASSNYKLKIVSIANCIESNSVNIDIQTPNIQGEFELFKGDFTKLTSTTSPNSLNPWISSNTSVATIDVNGNVSALSPGTTEITFTNDKDCSTTETISVASYTSFFTPNGDGVNDEWKLKGFENKEYKISIFNRYGKLLKVITHNDSGWNGVFHNRLLPENDYWFQLEYLKNNIPQIVKGHFSLVR